MANQKIIDAKAAVVSEIEDKVKNATSIVFFDYRGLTVTETNELRRKLRESNSESKVYKNTLTRRALENLKIDLGEELDGPKAVVFGTDVVAPIKVLNDFAKNHKALEMKIGYVDGKVTDLATLKKLANTPSRETLLTMFASGLLAIPRDFAICLDLHSKNLEG